VIRAAGVLLAACAAFAATATPDPGASVAAAIRADLGAPVRPLAGVDVRLFAPARLARLYADRSDAPGWVGDDKPKPAAIAMVDAIRASRADGLTPGDYHLEALDELLDAPWEWMPPPARARRLAALELLLSDAFLRLAADEAAGRLDPATLELRDPPPDLRSELRDALRRVFTGAAPGPVLQGLAPQDADYRGLRRALARYRELAARGEPPPVAPGPALSEGDGGPRVAALVRRLQSAGFLAREPAAHERFDADVDAALRRFQAERGLTVDGVAGPATLAALNRPATYWIGVLRVNLERRRWLPSVLPPTRVMVNVAAFHATLFTRGGPRVAERVIVGKRYQQTPQFSSRIAYLVVNPSWDVPMSIARREILPAVRRDRSYLDRNHYLVLNGWDGGGKRLDPARIDWNAISAAGLAYHFRQRPGPDNALGRVKFMFPNPYDVYMHDTPAKTLFKTPRRTFSHGCVRLDNALGFAAALLRADGRDDPEQVLAAAAGRGRDNRIELARPIPIYVVYMTAWAPDLNTIEFRPDIYGKDAGVLAALDAPDPSPSR